MGGRQQASQTDGVDLALLDAVVHHVDEAVLALAADGRITWASRGIRLLLGHDPGELVGANVLSFIHPDELEGLGDSILRWEGRSGTPRGEVLRLRAADGTWTPLRYDAVTGPEVAPLGACVITVRPAGRSHDNAAELRARDEASARVVRLASTFLHRGARPFDAALDDALLELSALEWVTRVSVWRCDNERARYQAHWEARVNVPSVPLPRQMPVPQSFMLRRLVAGEEVHARSVRHLPDEWATERDALLAAGVRSLLAVPLLVDGRCTGCIVAEVTIAEIGFDAVQLLTVRSAAAVLAAAFEREDVERELDRRARTDPLTGLDNRFAFDDAVDAALVELAAAGPDAAGLAVAVVDLDRFKVVNDALGHAGADRVFVEVAARFIAAAPAETSVARLGGDELLVLHRNVTSSVDAVARTRRLLGVLDAPVDVGGRPHVLSASAGVTFTDDPTVGRAELLRRAEAAMFDAKAAGGGRVGADDERTRAEVGRRLHRETELRGATVDGTLLVHYQAEWDLETGAMTGAEALARWQHPVEGLLAAGAFIPMAEESGLIVPVGERVLRLACAQLAVWHDDGVLPAGFVLRVNVSARQLRDHVDAALVSEVLGDHGLPPSLLCLELTESALLSDPDGAVRTLHELRDAGVGLAVDDFGTGYSSMLYLKHLPITALKLDQAFVAGLPHDAGDIAIVQATVRLAELFGVTLTAEGAETPEQLDALRSLGCRRAQGFGLSRPEPPSTLAARFGGAGAGEGAA